MAVIITIIRLSASQSACALVKLADKLEATLGRIGRDMNANQPLSFMMVIISMMMIEFLLACKSLPPLLLTTQQSEPDTAAKSSELLAALKGSICATGSADDAVDDIDDINTATTTSENSPEAPPRCCWEIPL